MKLIKHGFSTIIAADGGYHNCVKAGMVPHFIIGDFDSIGHIYKRKTSGIDLIKISRQSDTDVEKCIKFAISHGATEYILLGGIGNRIDHSFANFGYLLKYSDKISGKLFYGESFAEVCNKEVTLKSVKSEIISIYGFSDKVKVTSQGLKYKLSDSLLSFGKRESTSNVSIGREVTFRVKNGKILIIRNKESFFL